MGNTSWKRDRFESRRDFEMRIVTWIGRDVRALGLLATPRTSLGATLFQDSPRLAKRLSVTGCALELIRARERAVIQEHIARGIFAENIAGDFQHDRHAEVILLGGILNISSREEGRADLVFVQHR